MDLTSDRALMDLTIDRAVEFGITVFDHCKTVNEFDLHTILVSVITC